jgi:hypothetical protein
MPPSSGPRYVGHAADLLNHFDSEDTLVHNVSVSVY